MTAIAIALLLITGVLSAPAAIWFMRLRGGSPGVLGLLMVCAICGGIAGLTILIVCPIISVKTAGAFGGSLISVLVRFVFLAALWAMFQAALLYGFVHERLTLYTIIVLACLLTTLFAIAAFADVILSSPSLAEIGDRCLSVALAALVFTGMTNIVGYRLNALKSTEAILETTVEAIIFSYCTVTTFYVTLFTKAYRTSDIRTILSGTLNVTVVVADVLLLAFLIYHAVQMSRPWGHGRPASQTKQQLLTEGQIQTEVRRTHLFISLGEFIGFLFLLAFACRLLLRGSATPSYSWFPLSLVLAFVLCQAPYVLGEMQLRDDLQRELLGACRRAKRKSSAGELKQHEGIGGRILEQHPLFPSYEVLYAGPVGWLIDFLVQCSC